MRVRARVIPTAATTTADEDGQRDHAACVAQHRGRAPGAPRAGRTRPPTGGSGSGRPTTSGPRREQRQSPTASPTLRSGHVSAAHPPTPSAPSTASGWGGRARSGQSPSSRSVPPAAGTGRDPAPGVPSGDAGAAGRHGPRRGDSGTAGVGRGGRSRSDMAASVRGGCAVRGPVRTGQTRPQQRARRRAVVGQGGDRSPVQLAHPSRDGQPEARCHRPRPRRSRTVRRLVRRPRRGCPDPRRGPRATRWIRRSRGR